MRISQVITVSLPPPLVKESGRIAKQQHMTRSELLRTALRRYMENLQMEQALRIADEELRAGKAKALPLGGLAKLMQK